MEPSIAPLSWLQEAWQTRIAQQARLLEFLLGAPRCDRGNGGVDLGVARLLEQTARAIYESRGPRAIHAGQWAVLRYLARASKIGRAHV